MNAETLNRWIYKDVPGGVTLALVYETPLQQMTVATWPRAEVDALRDSAETVGAQLIEFAKDHTDSVGEDCKFSIVWQYDSGKPIRAIIHRCVAERGAVASHAQAVGNEIVSQLLTHIATQQKVINGSIGIVLQAFEKALATQQKMIDSQAQLMAAQAELNEEDAAPAREPSESELQWTALKATALQKLLEQGPEVVTRVIERLGSKPENSVTTPAIASNGVAA